MLWTELYKPQCLEEMIGIGNSIQIIDDWFKDFLQGKNTKSCIIIVGNTGIGKTTMAHLILKKYQYDIQEFNASDLRGPKPIKEIFYKLLQHQTVTKIYNEDAKPVGIIMDEIDGLALGGEKGGIAEFLEILNEKKRLKNKKLSYDIKSIKNPIICISNETNDKKINELRKLSLEIKLEQANKTELFKLINKIGEKEGFILDDEGKEELINFTMYDIRKLVLILQDLKHMFSDENNLSKEHVLSLFGILKKKDIDLTINQSVQLIFNEEKSVEECLKHFNMEKFLYPFLIHENFPYQIINKYHNLNDRINKIEECASYLSKNDVIQNFIFEKQNWELNDYSGVLSCAIPNKIVNSSGNMNEIDDKENRDIQFTGLLNKVSLFYTNRKVINTLKSKFGLESDDLYFLSEWVLYQLFNPNGNRNRLKELSDKYEINPEDIDLLLRINKFDSDEVKKKYTTKIKNEIKKIIGYKNHSDNSSFESEED